MAAPHGWARHADGHTLGAWRKVTRLAKSENGTTAARKALSAVARTGQRFGAGHLTDLLLGEMTDKIEKHGHERLKTFGVGAELDRDEWRSVFRQLVAAGLLDVDAEGHGTLRFTRRSGPVLRGEQPVRLRKDPPQQKARGKKVPRNKVALAANNDIGTFMSASDEALWDALKTMRTQLARQLSVPPYVIFHDRTLHALVERRPTSRDEMSEVYGIGRAKLDRYADVVIGCVMAHGGRGKGSATRS